LSFACELRCSGERDTKPRRADGAETSELPSFQDPYFLAVVQRSGETGDRETPISVLRGAAWSRGAGRNAQKTCASAHGPNSRRTAFASELAEGEELGSNTLCESAVATWQQRLIVQHPRWEPSALAAHARIGPGGAR